MNNFKKSTKFSTISLIFWFLIVVVLFNGTLTYAWFSSQLTQLDGDLNLGNLAADVHVYENTDDSGGGDTYIDGLTDVVTVDSNGTQVTTYDLITKPWYSNEYTSIYLGVENTGSIDLKSILRVSYDNDNVLTYLSYYYYQLVDITADVVAEAQPTDRENLSAYNTTFQANIASNVATYISNVTTNGNTVADSLPVINMGTTFYNTTSFYRLDIALSDIPTELLTEYNNLPVEDREIDLNAIITLKQTNAPDDNNDDSGLSVYISTADSFINAINSASNGDTLYLTTNLAISRNVTITHRVNLVLNGFDLTINGNLAYDYGSSGITTLDVSNSSTLYVLGDLIIDTPNSSFKLLGSGGSAQSVIVGDGVDAETGDVYINCLKDDNDSSTLGFYQYGVSIMTKVSEVLNELATLTIDSNTRVNVGLASTTGQIVSVNNASNIEVYNYGEINSIDFSNMYQLPEAIVQIYIYNANTFSSSGVVIGLPSWSLGWKSKELNSISNAVNTRIINAAGSVTGYSVTGSSVFLDIDIENVDVATDAVVELTPNYYRVNVQLDINGEDTWTVRDYLNDYFLTEGLGTTEPEFESWLTTVEGLDLYTYNTALIKTADFTFMNTYTTVLEYLSLTYSNIESDAIPASAFYNKTSLETVHFPINSLTIGDSAFYGTSLNKVTLSSNVTSIGTNAFDINTTQNGLLEVFYESENTSTLLGYISSLTPAKTLLFMSPSNLTDFKSNYAITDTWYINSYATYNFVDAYLNYYRIIDGDSVELVYYGGDWTSLNLFNTVIYDVRTYDVIGIHTSAFRRSINAAGTNTVSVSMPDNVTYVKGDAFYNGYIFNLDLNNVSDIDDYAFYNTTITTSSARPLSFTGMTGLGDYAFANTTIGTTGVTSLATFELANVTGGVINNSLELQGSYTPGASAFNNASLWGVKLDLEDVLLVDATMTGNMSLYGCEVNLNNVTEIGDSTFELKFKSYTELYPYNKVYATEVGTIGRLAFKGMYLDTFTIGVKTRYISQTEVNASVSYGGTTSGMIYSDFRATNLTIDGMIPEISSGKATFLFGSETAGRIYNTVTIKNTNGLLYDYLFYGSTAVNEVTIDDLHLYDISQIGSYSFYNATVTNIHSYSGVTPLTDSAVTYIDEYAFRYSTVGSFGDFTLTDLNQYAFADCTVPSTGVTVSTNVGDYAFYNTNTTNMTTVSLSGTIGTKIFNISNMHTIDTIYINGTIGTHMFEDARIYDATTLTFEDTTIPANTFLNAIISSAATVDTLGTCHAETNAFYSLDALTSTLDLTQCLTIEDSALLKLDTQTLRLGNTTFFNTLNNSFIYGTALGGIFTPNEVTNITNLYIDGQLPDQRLGTYVLGASGANLNITNIYIESAVTAIPDYMFYSENLSGRLTVSTLYIDAEDLTIGQYAFGNISVDNINYTSSTYGDLTFTGQYAFYFANIGDFTNFTYYDNIELEDTGIIADVSAYAFQYATFGQDSDLTVFEYADSIGNHAFDHATFTQTSSGQNVDLNLSLVPAIGYNVFEGIYSTLGTLTLGNQTYYDTHLPEYYYGNPVGDEGILTSTGSITVEEIIIAGNLPDSNVNEVYQTRALGMSGLSSVTITQLTIQAGVTSIPDFGFSGWDVSNRILIDTIDIYSTTLSIGESAFAYSDITYFNIYSSSIDLNTGSFEYSILRNMVYDRTSGAGTITFDAAAEYTFQYSTITNMTGFTDVSSGVVQEINDYSFYNATFATDCDISFIDYVTSVGYRAFSYATFNKTSGNANVDIDLSDAISLGEEIFAFIPVQLGSLTLGNSSYAATYGASYTYGLGVNGVLYAAGRIDTLTIEGNLPETNSNMALGNNYNDVQWNVDYGTINIDASVTLIPANVFTAVSATYPATIETLNVNATTLDLKSGAFYYANIGTVNFNSTTIDIRSNAFNTTTISTINIAGNSTDFGTSAFANSAITTINYTGATTGTITMSGGYTFNNTTIDVITSFTYIDVVEKGIVSEISDHAFDGAVFAQDCNVAWIQYVSSIGDYAFSGTTFNKTSGDAFVDINLTEVVTIGASAFYQLPISLGTITIGNDSYTSDPFYAYGDGTEGIFNNAGTIQHLIIEGALPDTANALGNQTSNISYLTTYVRVDINSAITTVPDGLFAGADTVYSTQIASLYIYPTSIVIGDAFLYNTVVTNLYIPNTTTFSGVGVNAFRNSSLTNLNVTSTLSLTGTIDAYAFHSFDFTGITLDVTGVSYIGTYAFSYMAYDGDLVFNTSLTMINADQAFSFANLSGNLTFNSIKSLGENVFNGLVSGTAVTYNFTFVDCLEVTDDYAFGNMNGGGSAYVVISGLPTLNSYRAFYNSTNIITITFNSDLINLNADNIFESATNLISIAFNNETYVTVVNATITTIPAATQVYVPGALLSSYLSDTYWSTVSGQISTTYNIDSTGDWGFFILGTTTDVTMVKYLGSLTTVTIPATITYNSTTYDVLSLSSTIFTGTLVTNIVIPRTVESVDMDLFSASNITDVSFTGTGTEPFYIANESGNKVIYDSSDQTVLYKYLPSNTATSYTIQTTVMEVAQKAFYQNDYIQTLTFSAGTQQNENSNSYSTTYNSDFTLASNAILECDSLTTINLTNYSSGYGVILNSYAISNNAALTDISITGFSSFLNSYAIYNNSAVELVEIHYATTWAFGSKTSGLYSNISIEPFAFQGSGTESGTACFYTDTFINYIHSRAFANSEITLFEFDVDISDSNYAVEVYNPDAFAVGVTVDVNGNGDIVQTYDTIVIRVPTANLAAYQALPGFSFYSTSIVGVATFTHTLP